MLFLGSYDLALKHYLVSSEIQSSCLPAQHPDIAMTYCNIGLAYEKTGQWQQALSHFNKAADIYRHVLSSTHPAVIKVEQFIKRVSEKSAKA